MVTVVSSGEWSPGTPTCFVDEDEGRPVVPFPRELVENAAQV